MSRMYGNVPYPRDIHIWLRATSVMVKLTAEQSYQIILFLLATIRSSQTEISRFTGASKSQVNRLVNDLIDAAVIRHVKNRLLEVNDPIRLLDKIAFERPLSRLVRKEIQLEYSEVNRVEDAIRKTCLNSKIKYAFTCFSALDKYYRYHITYPTVHVYTNEQTELESKLPLGKGAVLVQILAPDHEVIMQTARMKDRFVLVDPVQVIIDLFCLGSIGRDGAIKLWEVVKSGAVRSY